MMPGQPEADYEALGLPVGRPEPDDLAQPLEIALVVKGLDTSGKVSYYTLSTPSLMNVEIVGMLEWGKTVALYADDDDA